MNPSVSHLRLPIEIRARDFGDPIYARADYDGRFRDVVWRGLPPYYDTPDEMWILIERNGGPVGIVDCGLSDDPDEPLAHRTHAIGSHQIVAGDASLIEVLQRFTAGPPWFLLVLTGAQVTHWIEPLHLSSWPVKLALLAKCLEVDEALEKVLQLDPSKYLHDFGDVAWRGHAKNRSNVGLFGFFGGEAPGCPERGLGSCARPSVFGTPWRMDTWSFRSPRGSSLLERFPTNDIGATQENCIRLCC
jgi:hypothetical protein